LGCNGIIQPNPRRLVNLRANPASGATWHHHVPPKTGAPACSRLNLIFVHRSVLVPATSKAGCKPALRPFRKLKIIKQPDKPWLFVLGLFIISCPAKNPAPLRQSPRLVFPVLKTDRNRKTFVASRRFPAMIFYKQ
jgi:hypothetical protein